jgi:hypothetical protein
MYSSACKLMISTAIDSLVAVEGSVKADIELDEIIEIPCDRARSSFRYPRSVQLL